MIGLDAPCGTQGSPWKVEQCANLLNSYAGCRGRTGPAQSAGMGETLLTEIKTLNDISTS